jgi:hypothetical protein
MDIIANQVLMDPPTPPAVYILPGGGSIKTWFAIRTTPGIKMEQPGLPKCHTGASKEPKRSQEVPQRREIRNTSRTNGSKQINSYKNQNVYIHPSISKVT